MQKNDIKNKTSKKVLQKSLQTKANIRQNVYKQQISNAKQRQQQRQKFLEQRKLEYQQLKEQIKKELKAIKLQQLVNNKHSLKHKSNKKRILHQQHTSYMASYGTKLSKTKLEEQAKKIKSQYQQINQQASKDLITKNNQREKITQLTKIKSQSQNSKNRTNKKEIQEVMNIKKVINSAVQYVLPIINKAEQLNNLNTKIPSLSSDKAKLLNNNQKIHNKKLITTKDVKDFKNELDGMLGKVHTMIDNIEHAENMKQNLSKNIKKLPKRYKEKDNRLNIKTDTAYSTNSTINTTITK